MTSVWFSTSAITSGWLFVEAHDFLLINEEFKSVVFKF